MKLHRRLTLAHDGRPFLERWGLVHERIGGFYLHHVADADPGLDLHDHPWSFVSIVLSGAYDEQTCTTDSAVALAGQAVRFPGLFAQGVRRTHRRWSVHRMPLGVAHRIVLAKRGTWTLVLRGPTRRRWGFYTPDGWYDWQDYPYDQRRPCTSTNRVTP